MTIDNIDVNPGTQTNKVSVATDVVDNVHYPVYKLAVGDDGEAGLVTDENPVPMEALGLVDEFRNLLEVNREILNQLKTMNAHFAEWDGDEYGDD